MATDPLGSYELTRDQLGAEYPAELATPDEIVEPDRPIEVGGLRLETAQLGPAETDSTTVCYEPGTRTLFAGDLLTNDATPALSGGRSTFVVGAAVTAPLLACVTAPRRARVPRRAGSAVPGR
jgi:hypothetical protein